MPPGRPMNTPKSVIDLIVPVTRSLRLYDCRKFRPRIGTALLQSQRNAPALLVDLQHHDLDFLADGHNLGRIHVLVRPVHLGHVDQAFNALFDLDETAVVGNVRDLADEDVYSAGSAAQSHPRDPNRAA